MKSALVLCERSGIWSERLWLLGYHVTQVDWSLRAGEKRIRERWLQYGGDVREFKGWRGNVVVAFPPCDDLAAVGACHWKHKTIYDALAVLTFCAALAAGADQGLVENPKGLATRVLGRPSMVCDPWEFAFLPAEKKRKKTYLWLYNWAPPFVRFTGCLSAAESFVELVPGDGLLRARVRSHGWEGMAQAFIDTLPRASPRPADSLTRQNGR